MRYASWSQAVADGVDVLGSPMTACQSVTGGWLDRVSKSKLRHTIPVRHRDEVEPPITDRLAEAYELCGARSASKSQPGAGSGT